MSTGPHNSRCVRLLIPATAAVMNLPAAGAALGVLLAVFSTADACSCPISATPPVESFLLGAQ